MHDPGGEIGRLIARLRARLRPDRLGPALCWAVTRPDEELEAWGVELSDAERLELVAWALALARWRP